MSRLGSFSLASFMKSLNNGAEDESKTKSHRSRTLKPWIHMERTNTVPIKYIERHICTLFLIRDQYEPCNNDKVEKKVFNPYIYIAYRNRIWKEFGLYLFTPKNR